MEIVKLDIDSLTPYERNAKEHPQRQLEQIKESILKYGMNDPIGVWGKDNIIVEGHGRFLACKELGITQVDCIRLDHLSDDERKEYCLVHNKLTMNSDFDLDILDIELRELSDNHDFDFEAFDFELRPIEEVEDKNNERARTSSAYNLDLYDSDDTDGKYQMPIIHKEKVIPTDLIGFNYMLTSENKKCGVHCFVDDYQFERLWNNPEDYVEELSKYQCVFSPDFSLYMDMPYAMKIWNVYRSRMLGNYWQKRGVRVIPTVSWAEESTFEFCFDGIEKGCVVAISTIGVKQDSNALRVWQDGVTAMIEKIEPSKIIVYGGKLEYDFKDIPVIYFDNKVTERMKEIRKEHL